MQREEILIVTESMDWIYLVQDSEKWWVFAQCNEPLRFMK
jgi:hypothetical protein